MSGKYSEEQIQKMISEIKQRRPDRPDLATREFAIKTLDNTSSMSETFVKNLKSVAKKENEQSSSSNKKSK